MLSTVAQSPTRASSSTGSNSPVPIETHYPPNSLEASAESQRDIFCTPERKQTAKSVTKTGAWALGIGLLIFGYVKSLKETCNYPTAPLEANALKLVNDHCPSWLLENGTVRAGTKGFWISDENQGAGRIDSKDMAFSLPSSYYPNGMSHGVVGEQKSNGNYPLYSSYRGQTPHADVTPDGRVISRRAKETLATIIPLEGLTNHDGTPKGIQAARNTIAADQRKNVTSKQAALGLLNQLN